MTAAVLGGGGLALAAIPSASNGSFTACVNKTSGAVRIIDYDGGKRCTATSENQVAWSKGYTYRGAWVNTTAYSVLDVVTANGSSYLAKTASTGKAPAANPANWGVLAAAGQKGAPGGLSASVFSDDNAPGTPPTATVMHTVKQVTITTTQPGKLLILDATVESVSLLNTVPQAFHYGSGVYVDGVGVAGTASSAPGMLPPVQPLNAGPYSLGEASVSNVAAGTHTVAIKLWSSDAAGNYLTGASGRLLVVATG